MNLNDDNIIMVRSLDDIMKKGDVSQSVEKVEVERMRGRAHDRLMNKMAAARHKARRRTTRRGQEKGKKQRAERVYTKNWPHSFLIFLLELVLLKYKSVFHISWLLRHGVGFVAAGFIRHSEGFVAVGSIRHGEGFVVVGSIHHSEGFMAVGFPFSHFFFLFFYRLVSSLP
ncbi:hypothetical protein Patl1_15744 [Pistacia atlantica]|uniref:Uncharacterized protein n=1 Tax=Pistacia atlantica TaxID=434234 RepID=A0ACC1BAL4_9ROSI|nr:hypothetical protein Patl1_15744 [Pistacia atlantica]